MAITECGRGHVYDSNQYPACPYCNAMGNVVNFGGVGGYNNEKTIAPGMMGGAPTVRPMQGSAPANIPNPAPAPLPMANLNEPGETIAPDMYRKRQEEQEKTIGVFKKVHNIDPVVGWLVCIEGPEKGKDYHLWARINTIGRSEKMDVCIKKDNTISHDSHARLAYDPKHNIFRILPANSTNNIYLNDEPVYVPKEIKIYDIIEIGESKMVFIPLCGERFDWSTGVKDPEN